MTTTGTNDWKEFYRLAVFFRSVSAKSRVAISRIACHCFSDSGYGHIVMTFQMNCA
jgi:hypothetical protein